MQQQQQQNDEHYPHLTAAGECTSSDHGSCSPLDNLLEFAPGVKADWKGRRGTTVVQEADHPPGAQKSTRICTYVGVILQTNPQRAPARLALSAGLLFRSDSSSSSPSSDGARGEADIL